MADFQRGESLTNDFFPDLVLKTLSMEHTTSYAEAQRLMRYSTFWDFYTGKQWPQNRNDNEPQVTANFCEGFVNKSASFLMSKGWSIKDKDTIESKDNLAFLNKVWNSVNKDVLSYEMAQLGGIFGDVLAVVLPDNNGLLTIDLIPPIFVFPIWHPANNKILMAIKVQFPLDEQRNDSVGSTFTMVLDAISIRQWVDDRQIYFREHNLGEIPATLIRNKPLAGTKWGVGDLNSIIPLNKLYNEKLTDISDIINYHAAPVTVAYGVKIKQLQKGARKMWGGLPGPKDARIENLQMESDLAAADNHLSTIQRLIHQVGSVPEVAFGQQLEISNTSGLAIQLLFKPLTDITSIKQTMYGAGLVHLNRIIVKYGINFGYLHRPSISNIFDLSEYYNTSIAWPNPLPMDELLHLNMIMNRLKSGTITVSDALSELGVPNVQRYIQQIQEDVSTGRNYLLTAQIQTSLSKFVNMGGIMRDQNTPLQPDELVA